MAQLPPSNPSILPQLTFRKPNLVHGAWEDALRRWRVLRLARRYRIAQEAGDSAAMEAALQQYNKVRELVGKQTQQIKEQKELQAPSLTPAERQKKFKRVNEDGKVVDSFTWTDHDAGDNVFVPPDLANLRRERGGVKLSTPSASTAAAGEGGDVLPPPGVGAKEAAMERRLARGKGKGKGKGKGRNNEGKGKGQVREQMAERKRRRDEVESEQNAELAETKQLIDKDWDPVLNELKRQKMEIEAQKAAADEVAKQAREAREKLSAMFDDSDDGDEPTAAKSPDADDDSSS